MSNTHETHDDPIVVEKGVPIPHSSNSSIMSKYPFETMEVGDSFFRPTAQKQMVRAQAAVYKRYTPGWDYKTKTVPATKDNPPGVRLWRTA